MFYSIYRFRLRFDDDDGFWMRSDNEEDVEHIDPSGGSRPRPSGRAGRSPSRPETGARTRRGSEGTSSHPRPRAGVRASLLPAGLVLERSGTTFRGPSIAFTGESGRARREGAHPNVQGGFWCASFSLPSPGAMRSNVGLGLFLYRRCASEIRIGTVFCGYVCGLPCYMMCPMGRFRVACFRLGLQEPYSTPSPW